MVTSLADYVRLYRFIARILFQFHNLRELELVLLTVTNTITVLNHSNVLHLLILERKLRLQDNYSGKYLLMLQTDA